MDILMEELPNCMDKRNAITCELNRREMPGHVIIITLTARNPLSSNTCKKESTRPL